jgi:hypothetical protein
MLKFREMKKRINCSLLLQRILIICLKFKSEEFYLKIKPQIYLMREERLIDKLKRLMINFLRKWNLALKSIHDSRRSAHFSSWGSWTNRVWCFKIDLCLIPGIEIFLISPALFFNFLWFQTFNLTCLIVNIF